MTIQLIRSHEGKLRGVAVMFGKGCIEAAREGKIAWRVCDVCKTNGAIVFCASDQNYVCETCLPVHSMPGFCKYLSVSAARELATGVLSAECPWR